MKSVTFFLVNVGFFIFVESTCLAGRDICDDLFKPRVMKIVGGEIRLILPEKRGECFDALYDRVRMNYSCYRDLNNDGWADEKGTGVLIWGGFWTIKTSEKMPPKTTSMEYLIKRHRACKAY